MDLSPKLPSQQTARMIESLVGCKWSLTVYQLLAHGINRPGAMVRTVDGLTTKVLNDCLRKNVSFGVLERVAYNELPPRVEYNVTEFGTKVVGILEHVAELDSDSRESEAPAPPAELSQGKGCDIRSMRVD